MNNCYLAIVNNCNMKTITRVSFFFLICFVVCGCLSPDERLQKKVSRIHEEAFTIDAHCASAVNFMKNTFRPEIINEKGSFDFPRMQEGNLDASFFAIFPGKGKRNDYGYSVAYSRIKTSYDNIMQIVADNSSIVGIGLTPEDAFKLRKEGKHVIYLGIESELAIGENINLVKQYYDMGFRYMTLCFTTNSNLCDSSTDSKGAENNGLSSFGRAVVKEMNRLGMMVDASNTSEMSFSNIMRHSLAPVIVSHTACRAICSNQRNISDEMLLELKENGGVACITLQSQLLKTPEENLVLEEKLAELNTRYDVLLNSSHSEESNTELANYNRERNSIIRKYRELATVSDFVDHIDHVVQVIGVDYVGISSDFDGGGEVIGCRNVSEIENITLELLRRGYTTKEIEKIWGGNVMRIFKAVSSSVASQEQDN